MSPATPRTGSGRAPHHGIQAIQLDPFPAEDLYQVLARPGPYRWLVSDDTPFRAGYLDSLFAANALDRARVVAAQDHGIAQRWDKASLCDYPALRDMIAAWHA